MFQLKLNMSLPVRVRFSLFLCEKTMLLSVALRKNTIKTEKKKPSRETSTTWVCMCATSVLAQLIADLVRTLVPCAGGGGGAHEPS
jgi:hypothetical protein